MTDAVAMKIPNIQTVVSKSQFSLKRTWNQRCDQFQIQIKKMYKMSLKGLPVSKSREIIKDQ